MMYKQATSFIKQLPKLFKFSDAVPRLRSAAFTIPQVGGSITTAFPFASNTQSIGLSGLAERYRGLGIGRKMYGGLARKLFEDYKNTGANRFFTSDNGGATSFAAKHVWESLARRGWPVRSDPGFAPKSKAAFGMDMEDLKLFFKDKGTKPVGASPTIPMMYKQAGTMKLFAKLLGRTAPAAKGLGSFERYPALMAARRQTLVIPNARAESFPGASTQGQYRPKDNLLLVRGGLAPDVARKTLRHELTHMAQFKAPFSWVDKTVQAGLSQPGNSFQSGMRSVLAELGAYAGETKGLMAPFRGAFNLWRDSPAYVRGFKRLGASATALPYRLLTAAPIVGGLATTSGLLLKLKSLTDQLNQPKTR